MTRMQVALLTLGDPGRMTGGYLFHRRLADRAPLHGADLCFVSVPNLPLPWAMAAGATRLRSAELRAADAVVLDSIAAAAAAPWLGLLTVPIVGMLHQLPGGMEGSRLGRAFRAPFDRWAYRRAQLLMVASEWLVEELVAAGMPRATLRLVRPGKDPAAREPTVPATAGDRAALRAGRHIAALCIANWLPRKGIVELLDAVARLPDETLTLHLVGDEDADPAYARRVRARLSTAELDRRVVLHGVLPPDGVARLYASADIFVLPSFEEPYGTVWGEAMAAGLPVVGWRAGNLPFLADGGREALIVPTGDVDALAQALATLAHDPQLRESVGRAAAARAVARPTWDETAARFFEIIRQVGRRPPTPRPIRRR